MSLAQSAELEVSDRSTTGALTSTGGIVLIGSDTGATPGGTLSVNGTGSVTLDSRTILALTVARAGRAPAKDYSQLRARGAVTLGGAYLDLEGGNQSACPKLKRGDVLTLITAGSLTGKFYGVRNGATVGLLCQSAGAPPTVRIHYMAHSVTATVRRG